MLSCRAFEYLIFNISILGRGERRKAGTIERLEMRGESARNRTVHETVRNKREQHPELEVSRRDWSGIDYESNVFF